MEALYTLGLDKIGTMPDLGKELYREDSAGTQILLTGFDYNREAMKRQIVRGIGADKYMRVDAASLALEEDLRHRKTQFWETPQRPLVAETFVPMDPEASSFADATEYVWEKRTRLGEAEMHSSLNGVNKAPDVDEYAEFQKASIINAIISYGWTVEDDRIGGRIGYNFGMRRASLARDAIKNAFDRFLLTGASVGGKTFYGLFNHASITPVSGATGDWYNYAVGGSTSALEIFEDFRLLYTACLDAVYKVSGSNGEESPDTVAMSDRMESFLRLTKVDSTNRTSFMDELKKDYPEIKNWLVHRDLRDRDAGGTKDRILMYRKDPRVIAAAVPLAYQERPMIQEAFGQKVYAFGRIAPCELHDKRLIQYLDIAMH
jgi:hypothetical protein